MFDVLGITFSTLILHGFVINCGKMFIYLLNIVDIFLGPTPTWRNPQNLWPLRYFAWLNRKHNMFYVIHIWLYPTTFKLRVSFSPAPECVDTDCWSRFVWHPLWHQDHGCCCSLFFWGQTFSFLYTIHIYIYIYIYICLYIYIYIYIYDWSQRFN